RLGEQRLCGVDRRLGLRLTCLARLAAGGTDLGPGPGEVGGLLGHQLALGVAGEAAGCPLVGAAGDARALALPGSGYQRRLRLPEARGAVVVPQGHHQLTLLNVVPLGHQQALDLAADGHRQLGPLAGLHGPGAGIGDGALHRAPLHRQQGDRNPLRARHPVPDARQHQHRHHSDPPCSHRRPLSPIRLTAGLVYCAAVGRDSSPTVPAGCRYQPRFHPSFFSMAPMIMAAMSMPVADSIPSRPGEEFTSSNSGPLEERIRSMPATRRSMALAALTAMRRSWAVTLTREARPPWWRLARNSPGAASRSMAATTRPSMTKQ